jgi:hypothetical protein
MMLTDMFRQVDWLHDITEFGSEYCFRALDEVKSEWEFGGGGVEVCREAYHECLAV